MCEPDDLGQTLRKRIREWTAEEWDSVLARAAPHLVGRPRERMERPLRGAQPNGRSQTTDRGNREYALEQIGRELVEVVEGILAFPGADWDADEALVVLGWASEERRARGLARAAWKELKDTPWGRRGDVANAAGEAVVVILGIRFAGIVLNYRPAKPATASSAVIRFTNYLRQSVDNETITILRKTVGWSHTGARVVPLPAGLVAIAPNQNPAQSAQVRIDFDRCWNCPCWQRNERAKLQHQVLELTIRGAPDEWIAGEISQKVTSVRAYRSEGRHALKACLEDGCKIRELCQAGKRGNQATNGGVP